ncbi:DUF2207 family protein [Propionibacterium cyclohexanicum]|nr:DUF2207 domain-containing protein [Propionibacterium cyclohexanicum]
MGTADLIAATVITAAAILGCIVTVAWKGRDARPAHIAPGPAGPPPPGHAGGGRRVVRDTAPPGVRPGQLGMLLDARAETNHLVATIIDLAVRGCLTVAHEEDGSWTLRRTDTTPPDLLVYERTLLKKLFPTVQGRRRRTTSTLQITLTKGGFTTAREALARQVGEMGFFRIPPQRARRQMRRAGAAISIGGVLIALPLIALTGELLTAVAVVLAGLAVIASAPLMPARTQLGSTIRQQAEDFRAFLAAADPELIDWRRHPRAFSEFLAWTVVFGLSPTWTRLFQRLTDEGRLTPKTPWYLPVKESFWHREGHIEALGELVSELSAAIEMADRHEEATPDDAAVQRW